MLEEDIVFLQKTEKLGALEPTPAVRAYLDRVQTREQFSTGYSGTVFSPPPPIVEYGGDRRAPNVILKELVIATPPAKNPTENTVPDGRSDSIDTSILSRSKCLCRF